MVLMAVLSDGDRLSPSSGWTNSTAPSASGKLPMNQNMKTCGYGFKVCLTVRELRAGRTKGATASVLIVLWNGGGFMQRRLDWPCLVFVGVPVDDGLFPHHQEIFRHVRGLQVYETRAYKAPSAVKRQHHLRLSVKINRIRRRSDTTIRKRGRST